MDNSIQAKCHRYWPLSGAEQYGKLQVIFCSSTEFPDYALREFKLVDTQDGSSLNVKQFQYTDWPEESVPPSGSGLIDLIGQVQKWQRSSGDKPIVVHCRLAQVFRGAICWSNIEMQTVQFKYSHNTHCQMLNTMPNTMLTTL